MSLGLSFKKKIFNEESLIFLMSFIILWNLGFHILIYFPLDQSPDIQNYLAMAQLDFDQSPVRRYRVIIPLLVYLLNTLFGWSFNLFHPWSFEGDFSLCFSFLLINTSIMSFVMMMIYKICKSFQFEPIYGIITLVFILSSRWSAEISGLPLVDSLYLLSMVFALYGVMTKQWTFLIASIWIGPWAKEAFIFMVPVILFFAKTQRARMMKHLVFSGILVFCFRFLFDFYNGQDILHSIKEDMGSFSSLGISLKRLFSFHGIYEIFSVIGFSLLLPFICLLKFRKEFSTSYQDHGLLFYSYLSIIFFQALLSTDLSRMLYLSVPVLAVWIMISLKVLKKKWLD